MFPSLMADLLGIDCTPYEAVSLASHHGFRGIDLRLNGVMVPVSLEHADDLREAIQEAGLKPGYCSLLPGKMSVSNSEWSRSIQNLAERAKIAQHLGYRRTSTVVLPFHPDLPFEQAFDQHVGRVKSVKPILCDHGLTLGLEYVSPLTRRADQPHTFIHDMSGTLQLIGACGGGVGLMLDSFHWHCAGESVEDIMELKSEQVVVVHLNDAIAGVCLEDQAVTHRELPGASGVIDLEGFIAGLRAIGYDGPITVEPTNPCWNAMPADKVVAATSRSLRNSLSKAFV